MHQKEQKKKAFDFSASLLVSLAYTSHTLLSFVSYLKNFIKLYLGTPDFCCA